MIDKAQKSESARPGLAEALSCLRDKEEDKN